MNQYFKYKIIHSKMKIKILSDLHIEFYQFEPTYDGEDILILAGDISSKSYINILIFIKNYLSLSVDTKVILVLGNHDYFGGTLSYIDNCYRNLNIDRCYFLQNNSIVINGIRFFGSTMWTNILDAKPSIVKECVRYISDYKYIRDISPELIHNTHKQALRVLEEVINTSKEPIIIITHHLPTYESIHFLYENSSINHSFASTDMEHIFDTTRVKIPLWIHGHTHTSVDYIHNKTRVICNPRGYIKDFRGFIKQENKYFNPKLIIEYKDEYNLFDNCSYSFNSLGIAAFGKDYVWNITGLTQEKINKEVKKLCQRARWCWQDRIGDDHIIYTAFSPIIC